MTLIIVDTLTLKERRGVGERGSQIPTNSAAAGRIPSARSALASASTHRRRAEQAVCAMNDHFDLKGTTIAIRDGDGNIEKHEFCNWECLGHWAAEAAGDTLVLERS